MDLIAAATGITGLILFNFAWNQAPIVGWNSPYIIVLLIVGVLLFPAFFYIEIKISSNPLIPLDIFTPDNAVSASTLMNLTEHRLSYEV